MSRAKQISEWSRASSMMALQAEMNRNKQKRPRPFSPADFNPFLQKPKAMGEISDLKVFLNGK